MSDEPYVLVSSRQMRQLFHGCEPTYIRDVCKGACCRSSKSGTFIQIAADEVGRIAAQGGRVVDGLLVAAGGRCQFQARDSNLCELHETPDKPFGCVASPFVLTSRDTLVVRNRYRLLRCYGAGLPAYRAFAASLRLLFGRAGAGLLEMHLDRGGDDLRLPMLRHSYRHLKQLAGARA
jgi:Putative zinc- or iron-chelating domain